MEGISAEDVQYITKGNVWNPDMTMEDFCDHNRFPTYSMDAQNAFYETVNRYFEVVNRNRYGSESEM